MAATQQVVIKLTTTGNTRQIRQHRNELIKLAAAGKIANYDGQTLAKTFEKLDKRLDTFRGTVMRVGKALASMNRIALKLFTVGFALGAASLTLVNALFAAGRVVANLYKTTMQALAAVVAAVGAALFGAAAAMREYTAAVQAYAFKTSPALGSKLFESRAALRMLHDDAILASFGIQALNQAYANIAKSTQVTGMSKNLLRGIADFAAAGGDPAKNLAAAAEFVGLLQKAGKLDQKALAAAEQLGPTFVDALKKAKAQGVSSLGDLAKMIQSGELARLGGVQGQAATVAGTLMGQFKSLFGELNIMAADFGQALLGPVKEAMQDVGVLLKRLMMRVGPEMVAFGQGGLLGGLVSMFEKLEDFTVKLFREYLPGANGMMARFASWWRKVLYWYNDFVDGLRQLLPLGRAVIEAFGEPFMAIFQTVGDWIRYVGESIKNNQAAYNRFGQALLDFIRKIQDLGRKFIDTFTEALPFLSQMIGFIGTAVDLVMNLVGAFGMVANVIGSIVGMLGGQSGGLGAAISMIPFLALFGSGSKHRRRKMASGGIAGGLLGNMFYAATGIPIRQKGGGQGGQAAPPRMPIGQRISNTVQAYRGRDFLGGADAAQLGMLSRMRNAYGGAGKGGANFMGRLGAANLASTRAMKALPGAGMGAATALMLGSLFAAPEAQGSLMAGGALASLAPMLGKAGPYAALAGVALGGLGAASKAQTGAGGAAMGAMGGAAAGAAIGTLVPVIGTALGAVLGAAAGAVYGYFKGKSNKDKKQAKEAASDYMNVVYGDLSKEFFRGDTANIRKTIDRLRENVSNISRIAALGEGQTKGTRRRIFDEQLAAGTINKAQYDALVAAPGTYRRELEKSLKATEALIPMADRFDTTAKVVENALGITSDQLLEMANAAGVNLFDDTVRLTDTLKALGLAMNYTAEQVRGAMRDIQVAAMEGMQQRVAQMSSGQAMDEMLQSIVNTAKEGPVELEQLSGFLQDFLGQLNLRNPNATFRNLEMLRTLFGPEGIMFLPGMQAQGMQQAFAPIQAPMGSMIAGGLEQGRAGLVDMVTRQLLFSGIGVDRAQLTGIIGGMSATEMDKLVMDLAAGRISADAFGMQGAGDRGVGARRSAILGNIGLGGLEMKNIDVAAMTIDQKLAMFGEEGVAVMEGMNNVIQAAFKNKPTWMDEAPKWYTMEAFKEMIAAAEGDTSTPRGIGDTTSQRLGKTLRRHNYFNSMFSGRRNVTSAYRTTGLGSINSDHITGRAYDLTGDNLGAYATAVNRMGGFAEFHGTGGSRHLHVVPGETPMGDATVPYSGTMSSGGSNTSVSNSYNIVVNGAPGMDVRQLADAVMDRIKKIERDQYERS